MNIEEFAKQRREQFEALAKARGLDTHRLSDDPYYDISVRGEYQDRRTRDAWFKFQSGSWPDMAPNALSASTGGGEDA